MMLRSSSTPVLGSLLSSFSETPNHHHNSDPFATLKHPPAAAHQKRSFHHSLPLNYTQFSINSSPISPSISDISLGTNNGFRRAQSEGNLEGLIASEPYKSDDELSAIPKPPKKLTSRRPNWSHLETIPSFHYHNERNRYEDDIKSEEEEEEEGSEREEFEGTNYGGGCFENSMEGQEKYYMGVRNRAVDVEKESMGLDEEIRLLVKEHSGTEMYLARGLGVGGFDMGFGGGSHHNNGGSGGGSCGGGGGGGGGEGNKPGIEEHYKRLVEENPGNPLCLRNYAQFLYESKGDLRRAEEYYSRAILADSEDGDLLSQYAKLVWELHHDQDRALCYFERAVHAAPADSHVHAAYASFLWETEEDEDGDDRCVLPSHYQNGAMASAKLLKCPREKIVL